MIITCGQNKCDDYVLLMMMMIWWRF